VRRWQTFLPIAPALSQQCQLHALDFRGHGRSKHAAPYRVMDYVIDAEAVLHHLDQPAVLYGHSLGAMVAAAVAARNPALVRALVMEDPPFHTMGARLAGSPLHAFFAALAPFAGSTLPLPDLVREVGARRVPTASGIDAPIRDLRDRVALRFSCAALQRMDPLIFPPILDGTWLNGYDWISLLATVECPALLLQADPKLGGMLTDEDAAESVSLIRDCSLVKLPCGHVMHWALSAQVAQVTVEFLECL